MNDLEATIQERLAVHPRNYTWLRAALLEAYPKGKIAFERKDYGNSLWIVFTLPQGITWARCLWGSVRLRVAATGEIFEKCYYLDEEHQEDWEDVKEAVIKAAKYTINQLRVRCDLMAEREKS